jgi:hypothetical protein
LAASSKKAPRCGIFGLTTIFFPTRRGIMTDRQNAEEEIKRERVEYWIPLRGRALELAIQEFAALKYVPKSDEEIFLRAETIINYLETGIPRKPGT